MSLCISVDVRESNLFKLLESLCESHKHVVLESVNLELGDIVISSTDTSGNRTDLLCIERKTILDLASSIRDGRYKEQSYRLFHHSIPNHHIMYILEGNLDMYNPRFTSVPKSAILSACISLQYYKGFSVHKTESVRETAEFIVHFVKKINKESNLLGFYNGAGTTLYDNIEYTHVVKKKKKDNITPENISVLLLSQIPCVSDIMANAILKDFPCFREFVNKIHENNNILDTIIYQTSTGKSRKIPKNVKQNIIQYLCM